MNGEPCRAALVYDETLTAYDFGPTHPMSPVRVDLTVSLARKAGVLDRIRTVVDELAPGVGLRGLLYGGSVTAANAGALLDLPDLDGLFVGRAAWTADGFAALLHTCGDVATRRTAAHPVDARAANVTSDHLLEPTPTRRSR